MAPKAPSATKRIKKTPAPAQDSAVDTRLIKRFIDIMESNGLAEIEYQSGEIRVKLRKFEAAPEYSRQTTAATDATTHSEIKAAEKSAHPSERVISSPFVGRFYCKPAPDSDPFVEPGARIEKGATLCIIEAMKLMNEIDSEFACIIVETLATDGQIVEYGTPLFKVRPL